LVPELFRLMLGISIRFQDYLVFAHLRRAGFSLDRLGRRPETTLVSAPSNIGVSGESEADLVSWLMVKAVPQPSPVPFLPAQSGGFVSTSSSDNSSIAGAASGAAEHSCWILHRTITGRRSNDISSRAAAGRSSPVVHTVDPSESVHALMERLIDAHEAGSGSDGVAPPLLSIHPPPIFAVADVGSGSSPVFLQLLPPERPRAQQEAITCVWASLRTPSVESLGKVTGDANDSSASEKDALSAHDVEPAGAAAAVAAVRVSTTTASTGEACKSSDYAALRARVVSLVSSTSRDGRSLSCGSASCLDSSNRKRQKVAPMDESWFS